MRQLGIDEAAGDLSDAAGQHAVRLAAANGGGRFLRETLGGVPAHVLHHPSQVEHTGLRLARFLGDIEPVLAGAAALGVAKVDVPADVPELRE